LYRRVMCSLKFEAPSKRDTFAGDLDTKLSNIACYDRNVNHGEDEEGNPISTVDVRPEQSTDADDLYSFIKNTMEHNPHVSGYVHWHDCKHDEPPENWEPCKPEGKYEK